MLLMTKVKSGLIFQHERGLWKTFLQLDCLFPLRASLFLMLTVGEWLESVNKLLQVSPMDILPLFITVKQFFVRTLRAHFCLGLPDGMRLHTFSPGP